MLIRCNEMPRLHCNLGWKKSNVDDPMLGAEHSGPSACLRTGPRPWVPFLNARRFEIMSALIMSRVGVRPNDAFAIQRREEKLVSSN